MATVYKSKLGWETIVIILVLLVPYFVISFNNFDWIATTCIISLMFFIVLFSHTSTIYTINKEALTIKSMVFYKQEIKISSIRKIVETRNIMSSPAPSFDRIEIWFNGYDSVMISPKDKEGFVNQLNQINPAIEFVRKKG